MYCRGKLGSGSCFLDLMVFSAGVLLHPCGSGLVTKPGMQTALLHWGVTSCLSLSTCLKRPEQWCWRELKWDQLSAGKQCKGSFNPPVACFDGLNLMLIVIRVTRAGRSRTLMCWFSRGLSIEAMTAPSVWDISASNQCSQPQWDLGSGGD